MAATQQNFAGVIAPLVTPFGADGAPDADRFIDHADWLLANGCTALAPFGTTSEANSLGLNERMELLDELVDAGIDADQLMPGTGTCSLSDTVELTQHAVDLGCGGCLMLPPFYYKGPSEEGLYRYFSEVIEKTGDDDLRVYLYHIPPIAQVGFSLALIGRLAKAFPGVVVGLKDSSGDWSNTRAILEAQPGLEIFPGSEAFLLEGLRAGAAGVISATANVNPAAMRALYDAWKTPEADGLQAQITGVRKLIQAQPLIPLVKGLIAHYLEDPQWAQLRAPLMACPDADVAAAVKALEAEHGFQMVFADDGE